MDHYSLDADAVRAIRQRLGVTQRELARLIGVQREAVARWESRERGCTGPAAALIRLLDLRPEIATLLRDWACEKS